MVVKGSLCNLNLGFYHENPIVFIQSQWQRNDRSILFLLYRWILAAFFIGILAYSWTRAIRNGTFAFWFIYLTNLGLIFCIVATTFAAILATFYYRNPHRLESQSTSYKFLWFWSNVAVTSALVITIVYWTLLFDGRTDALDILIHGGNSAAMIIDLLIACHPMYIIHFIWPVGLGILYLIFTVIYYFAGGVDAQGNRYIYDVLDWSRTDALDILIHGGNSAAMIIDLLIACHPMYIIHFVYPVGVGILYMIFTIIYYFAGGVDAQGNRYIYDVLDWSNPGSAALTSIGTVILAIFLHVIVCLIQTARRRIHKKYFKKQSVTNYQVTNIAQHI
ncbi:CLUMA_CG001695, isoform A [Clunio marinus]|uniref:CLUMA_CG001695, isoform A n=1 Tax=Clunio marinus TaxID=568069 RepID=A0A1J1HKH2_9DIPT|nr:CLUMA_CG001695, isoform A [Clunio marinus]